MTTFTLGCSSADSDFADGFRQPFGGGGLLDCENPTFGHDKDENDDDDEYLFDD